MKKKKKPTKTKVNKNHASNNAIQERELASRIQEDSQRVPKKVKVRS